MIYVKIGKMIFVLFLLSLEWFVWICIFLGFYRWFWLVSLVLGFWIWLNDLNGMKFGGGGGGCWDWKSCMFV